MTRVSSVMAFPACGWHALLLPLTAQPAKQVAAHKGILEGGSDKGH